MTNPWNDKAQEKDELREEAAQSNAEVGALVGAVHLMDPVGRLAFLTHLLKNDDHILIMDLGDGYGGAMRTRNYDIVISALVNIIQTSITTDPGQSILDFMRVALGHEDDPDDRWLMPEEEGDEDNQD